MRLNLTAKSSNGAGRGDTTIARFLAKVNKNTSSGCWEWIGSLDIKGYGRFGFLRKNHYAHRVSWIIHNGPIPSGLFVCHKCDNPKCVNPSHLFLGTHADNMRDMARKGRAPHGWKPKCKQGHPYSGDNLYITTKGERVCRECQRAWNRALRSRRAAR